MTSPASSDPPLDQASSSIPHPASETSPSSNGHVDPPSSMPTDPNADPSGVASVFSGWGIGVNAVTNMTSNIPIPSLFSSDPDPAQTAEAVEPPTTATPSSATARAVDPDPTAHPNPDDDLGKTAAQLANVASAELGQAANAAQQTIGKASQELARGWGQLNTFLDDMLAPDAKRWEDPNPKLDDIHAMFRDVFPNLDKDDEVVDHYRCALLQKYRCYLNNATPEKTFRLRGRLFVTTSTIAMYVTEDDGAFGGLAFGVNIPFQDVVKIQKGSKSMLRVVTKAQTSFIFADFDSDTHYSGALSLLEQLAGPASGSAPAAATPTAASAGATDPDPDAPAPAEEASDETATVTPADAEATQS